MAVLVFRGYVRDGEIYLEQEWRYTNLLVTLEGAVIELIVRRHREGRSNAQNRYLHGVVIPLLADHLGYTRQELKDALKWKFLRVDGRKLTTVRSTASLNTLEMSRFIDDICRLAAELGITIPSPGEAEEDAL